MSGIIKNVLTKSIDYLTLMSYKHAHNLVINEERAIIKSLKSQTNKPTYTNFPNVKSNKIIVFDSKENDWLHQMSIKQSMN